MVGSHEVAGNSEAVNKTMPNGVIQGHSVVQITQNVAKSMADNTRDLSGDFQPAGCLFHPSTGS